jgi:two-component sensor histidine kinase
MGVGENAATGLALVIHELATNSLKYELLSIPEGTLDISGKIVGEAVEIGWSEQGAGGFATHRRSWFGRPLVQRTMRGILRGSISHAWPTSGVQVTMRIAPKLLALKPSRLSLKQKTLRMKVSPYVL